MSCTSTSYSSTDSMHTGAEPVPGSGSNLGGPYLVVSNEPEDLSDLESADVQLYKCEIPLTANTTQRIRVFVWHLGRSGGNTFHLALKLGAGTGTVSNFVGHEEHTTNFAAAGICCAQAVLYNSYDQSFSSANLSTTEAVIYSHSISGSYLLGAVLEFDVQAGSTTTLYLRTYVGSVDEDEDPPDGQVPRHIRGWWPYSEATFAVTPTVNSNPAATTVAYAWCPIEEARDFEDPGQKITPPELVSSVFGHRDEDTYGWPLPNNPDQNYPLGGNVGLYGAIVKYSFTVSNSDQTSQHAAWLRIYGRNNGGSVFGAAQITQPSGYPQWVVSALGYDQPSGPAQGVWLTQKPGSGVSPIMVPANTSSQTVTVKFTAGGASALPGNLYLYALRESAG